MKLGRKESTSLICLRVNMPLKEDPTPMPSKSTVYSALEYVASSLSPYLPLANCHTVDVLVYDMWHKVLPQSLQQDLDKTSVDALCQMLGPSDRSQQVLGSIKEECPSLHEFLSLLHSLHLSCLGVLSSKQEVYQHLQLCSEAAPVDLGRLMSEKKMHEVTVMAQLVATLCTDLGATWVCDVGAGKGYLSALLARHYKLNVLAVDSSPGNVSAAKMYSQTLQRELNKQRKNKIRQFTNDGQEPLHSPAFVGSSSYNRDGGTTVGECNANIQTRSENYASVNGVNESCCKVPVMCSCNCQEAVTCNDPTSPKSGKTILQTSDFRQNFFINSLCPEENSVGGCDQHSDIHNSSRTFSLGEHRNSDLNQRPKIEASRTFSLGEDRDSDSNKQPKTEATAQYLCVVKHVTSSFCILDTMREAFYLNELADSAEIPSHGSRHKRRHCSRKNFNKRKPELGSKLAGSFNARDNFGVRSFSEKGPRHGHPKHEIKACSLEGMSSTMEEEMSRLGVDNAVSDSYIVPICSSDSSSMGERFTIINNPINDSEIKSVDTSSKNEPLGGGRKTESLHWRKNKDDIKRISSVRSRSLSMNRSKETLAKSNTRLCLRDKSKPSDTETYATNIIGPPNFTINEPLINKGPMEPCDRSEPLNSEGKKHRRRNTAPPVGKSCVCALHACGDLAVHALRTYLADDTAVASCTVGCCYHLVTEETGDDGPHAPQISPSYPHGFPLTSLLRGYRLGRSARMAASQPLPRRMRDGLQDSESQSHYWRALLQLVIVRQLHRATRPTDSRTPTPPNAYVLHDFTSFVSSLPAEERDALSAYRAGRGLADECGTFGEYARRAYVKLPDVLKARVKLDEEDLTALEQKLLPQQRRLQQLCLLRGALGAAVEGLLLLDRLAFLLQQDRCQAAFLLPLFDPLQSPRCHAIVAIK